MKTIMLQGPGLGALFCAPTDTDSRIGFEPFLFILGQLMHLPIRNAHALPGALTHENGSVV
jgi:hypothetical protein